jgi:hypothetical protein
MDIGGARHYVPLASLPELMEWVRTHTRQASPHRPIKVLLQGKTVADNGLSIDGMTPEEMSTALQKAPVIHVTGAVMKDAPALNPIQTQFTKVQARHRALEQEIRNLTAKLHTAFEEKIAVERALSDLRTQLEMGEVSSGGYRGATRSRNRRAGSRPQRVLTRRRG